MLVRHRTNTPTIDRSLDRAFEQLTNSFFDGHRSAGPVVDGSWADGDYVLTVDLPGVPADHVKVEVSGDMLVLGARVDDGEWQRSLRLGNRLDANKVTAHHVDGRLTVRIGTVDEPEARSIEIDTTRPAISATASDEAADDDQSIETTATG